MHLTLDHPWLTVDLDTPHDVLSWAPVHPGARRTRHVVWREVTDDALTPSLDPVAWLQGQLSERGRPEAVGLLTACRVHHHVRADATVAGVQCGVVATVGLTNRLRVGDAPGPLRVDTINLLARVSVALTPAARLEALSLVAAARTAAVVDLEVQSRGAPGGVATGTGTDCIVVASPTTGTPTAYSGMHTAVGSAVGRAVYDAVHRAGRAWLSRRAE